jgi:hypothetical protein
VGLPFLAIALGISGLWMWKQQLTQQLRGASADLRLEECLLLERRLQILEWVPSPPTQDSGRCRREAAERLWQGQKQAQALRLQQELVTSKAGKAEDIERLQEWKGGLQRLALQAFERGELEKSLAMLRLTDTAGGDPGIEAMVNQFQQSWSKNRLDVERASTLAAKGQWWEALSALNGLSHPYWRQKSIPLRQTVEAGLAKVEKNRVKVHGPLPYAIPSKRLDELVKKRVAAGVPDWQAFSEACRALGGRLEDNGPEATCER